MQVEIYSTPEVMGQKAAELTARLLNLAIDEKGGARLLLSTGASQFTTLGALVMQEVDWKKVEMFHLDEYLDVPEDHPASFVHYLRERVESKIDPKHFYYVDVSQGAQHIMDKLTREIQEKPIDVGLIGIGENAHVAFNDPPADFEDPASYKVVDLDEACRRQQLGEGWFDSLDEVPRQAISMTVSQIMKCRAIVSAVPYAVKAQAVYNTLSAPKTTPLIPATILRNHPMVWLFLDEDSALRLDDKLLAAYK